MSPPTLSYVIEYVADMDAAVRFYRDILGFPLRFQSPGWSELETGATTLALHPADARRPAGAKQLGVQVADLRTFCDERAAQGARFLGAPAERFGTLMVELVDADGATLTVSQARTGEG